MKMMKVMSVLPIVENGIEFWRTQNDKNGNPQYIFKRSDLFVGKTKMHTKWELATQSAMKQIGAKPAYRGDNYFCIIKSYDLEGTAKFIKDAAYKMLPNEL